MMPQQRNDNEAKSLRLSNRWVHKRTLMVVAFFVILPWMLIAIPGTHRGGGGSTGLNVIRQTHGWPFVHLDTTRVEVWGNSVPPNLDLDQLAREWATESIRDVDAVQLDLRFEREDMFEDSVSESGFWSDSFNWPFPETGLHLTPRYLGLFLNLLFVAVNSGLLGATCEYRIRRYHRLTRFSVRTLMIFMTLIGLVLAWLVQEYSDATAEANLNHSLSQFDDDGKLFVSFEYETRCPQVVAQLLNYGKHPWGSIRMLSRIKSGNVYISLDDELKPDAANEITKLAIESGYAITLDVRDFNTERQTTLCAFDGAKVVNLSIDFGVFDWVYQMIDDQEYETDWEEAVRLANLKLDLKINLPHLERLTLKLDTTIDQVDQLKPFLGMASLEGNIINLSNEGAEFILKTKSQWPENTGFEFLDDVSEELRANLKSEFNAKPNTSMF
jgi:hypothetical protein